MSRQKTDKSPRTKPFKDSETFQELARLVGEELTSRGLTSKSQKGSESWKGYLPDASDTKLRHTLAKLCFYGKNKDGSEKKAFFGLRDVVIPEAVQDMEWVARGVPPRSEATFCGILVDLESDGAIGEIRTLIELCLPDSQETMDNKLFLAEVKAKLEAAG